MCRLVRGRSRDDDFPCGTVVAREDEGVGGEPETVCHCGGRTLCGRADPNVSNCSISRDEVADLGVQIRECVCAVGGATKGVCRRSLGTRKRPGQTRHADFVSSSVLVGSGVSARRERRWLPEHLIPMDDRVGPSCAVAPLPALLASVRNVVNGPGWNSSGGGLRGGRAEHDDVGAEHLLGAEARVRRVGDVFGVGGGSASTASHPHNLVPNTFEEQPIGYFVHTERVPCRALDVADDFCDVVDGHPIYSFKDSSYSSRPSSFCRAPL